MPQLTSGDQRTMLGAGSSVSWVSGDTAQGSGLADAEHPACLRCYILYFSNTQ